jgi:streptomycin 6-kinase
MVSFITNITNLYGQEGQFWLSQLPGTSRYFADLWGLGELTPVENLSYNAVYFSTQKPMVLKLGCDRDALAREAKALTAYQGQGSVRLLQSDIKNGALLIERSFPGISLQGLFPHADSAAVAHAATIMKRLHTASIPDPSLFPTLQHWFSVLDIAHSLPAAHLAKAKELAHTLLKTSKKTVLLHGDLHHGNILSQEGDWVAIDPKGVLGDPAYEVGAFINNPIPDILDHPDLTGLLQNRASLFAKLLGYNPQQLYQWSYIQSMVSAGWMVEDNSDPSAFLKITEALAGLIEG